jgi:dissimilatory sulfite reductase (desulfoviridin) alpha/beta subunit
MGSAFKLTNGSILISTEAPGGLYNAAQLKKIAALCDSDAAVVRATEDQRIALFVHEDQATNVVKELRSVGLGVRNYQEGLHQPISCVGVLCSEHKQDALSAAMEISESLGGEELSTPLKIGINGCGKCCVATHTLDVSLVGEENGYKVGIGGKNAQIPEMASLLAEGVPGAELPALMTKLITAFRNNAEPGERLQETIERVGTSSFVEAFAPYSQDAAVDNPFAGNETADDAAAPAAPVEEDVATGDESMELETDTVAEEATSELTEDVSLEETVTPEASEDIDSMNLEGSSEELLGDAELNLDAENSGEASVSAQEQSGSEELMNVDTEVVMAAEPDVDLSLDDVSAVAEPDMGDVSLENSDDAMMSPEVAEVALVNEESTNIETEHLDDMQLDGVHGEESKAVDSALGDHTADLSLEPSAEETELKVTESSDEGSASSDEIISIDTSDIQPEEVNFDEVNLEGATSPDEVELNVSNVELESADVVMDMEPEIIPEEPLAAAAPLQEIASEEHHDDLQLGLVPEDSVGIEDHSHDGETSVSAEAPVSAESVETENLDLADEAKLEDDINLDIEAEASVPADSDEEATNAADRLETLRLVKTAKPEAAAVGSVSTHQKLDPMMDQAMIEDDVDSEFNDSDAAQPAADLGEIGAVAPSKASAPAAGTTPHPTGGGSHLTDVSSTRDGGWKLSFANGMGVEISVADLEQGSRKMTLAGVRIEIEVAENEVKIRAGGICISMPQQKAA